MWYTTHTKYCMREHIMEDRYDYNRNLRGRRPNPTPGESMAGSAMILGVVAIMGVCCIYPGMICGALAIIPALLSRGQNKHPVASGKIAMALGTVAIVLTVLTIVINVAYILTNFGSFDAFMESYKATLDELTGGAYSEMYGSYGF